MKSLKSLVLGIMLGLVLAMPSSLKAADRMYQIISSNQFFKDRMRDKTLWTKCGDYFSLAETIGGKAIHFVFLKSGSRVNVYSMTTGVILTIDEKMSNPQVDVIEQLPYSKFLISISPKDYATLLSCFGAGKTA